MVPGSEPCSGSCPLCCLGHRLGGLLDISYSIHVLLPGGSRAAAGAPKQLQSLALRHDRRGSGAIASRGADCQTKGRGQRPGCLVPRGRGAGVCGVWVPAQSGGCCCPPAPCAHCTLEPTWHSLVPGGTALALVLCDPPKQHCARSLAISAPTALPVSGCSGAGMGCSEAQGYGEGAAGMDEATAEDGKHWVDPPRPTMPQFLQLLLRPL